MCRTYEVTFAECGGHHFKVPPTNLVTEQPEKWSKTYHCPKYPSCGPEPESVEYVQFDYCPLCLQNQNPHFVPHPGDVRRTEELVKERIERLLSLAAEPDKQYRTFPNEIYGKAVIEGEHEHIYDSHNPFEFCGTMTPLRLYLLGQILDRFLLYILDKDTPELTPSQKRLYYQLRIANIVGKIDVEESEKALQDSQQGEMARRLNTVLTPVPPPEADDEKDCPICTKPYGSSLKEGEASVQLPCSHVVGQQCIEAWVDDWKAGNPFWVCPLCRDAFELITPWECYAGVNVPEERSVMSNNWWCSLFGAVWVGPEPGVQEKALMRQVVSGGEILVMQPLQVVSDGELWVTQPLR